MKKKLILVIFIAMMVFSAFAAAQDLTPPSVLRWTFERYADPLKGQLFMLTSESATCRYSTKDVAYEEMTTLGSTGTTKHYQDVQISEGENLYYARCKDNEGNTNQESTIIKFTPGQVAALNCPLFNPPFCPKGRLISGGKDSKGCELPRTCCNDGSCKGKETAENCPEDCGKCAMENERVNRDPSAGFAGRKCCENYKEILIAPSYSMCTRCGNKQCDYPEDKENCNEDCKTICPKAALPTCEKGYLISLGNDRNGCPIGLTCCGNKLCDKDETFKNCPADCELVNIRLTKVWTDANEYKSGDIIKVYAKILEEDGTPATPSEGAKVTFSLTTINNAEIMGHYDQIMTYSSTEGYYVGTNIVPKNNPIKIKVYATYAKETIKQHTNVIKVTDIGEENVRGKEKKEEKEKEKTECEKKDGYCTDISECKEGYTLNLGLGCGKERGCCILAEEEIAPQDEEEPEECEGCEKDGQCVPYGTRIVEEAPKYCSLAKTFELQGEEGNSCQNNYECKSNECSNGQCVSTYNLLQKIFAWLKKLF